MRLKLFREGEAFLFTLPALVPLLLFWFGPLGYIFYLSFTEWDFMSPEKLFVGLDNYRYLLTHADFYRALRVTLLFGVGTVVPIIVGGLALALLMNSKLRATGWMRALLFTLAAVLFALAARFIGEWVPFRLVIELGQNSVDSLLQIIATAMLTATTFSITAMVTAYSSATTIATEVRTPWPISCR